MVIFYPGWIASGLQVALPGKSCKPYTLLDHVEKLILQTGAGNIDGTGNGLKNTLTGNEGVNVLEGGAGADTLIGGLGNDTYRVNLKTVTGTTTTVALEDKVTETSTGGIDTLVLLGGNEDLIKASTLTLAATLENIDASATGTTKLNLNGNAAGNEVTGNDADNLLAGKAGNDTLTGGEGNDTFRFDTALSATNVDVITDFATGDKIQLENAIFTKLTVPGVPLSAANFFSSAGDFPEQGSDDYILFDNTTGALYYDADGSGTAAARVQFATINYLDLAASDFVVS